MLSKFQGIQSDMNAVVMKRVALIFEVLLINTLIDFLFDIFVKLKVQSLCIELFLIFFHNIKTLDFINLFQLKIMIKNVLETILVVQIIMYRFLRVIILGQCHRKDVWDTIRRVLYS